MWFAATTCGTPGWMCSRPCTITGQPLAQITERTQRRVTATYQSPSFRPRRDSQITAGPHHASVAIPTAKVHRGRINPSSPRRPPSSLLEVLVAAQPQRGAVPLRARPPHAVAAAHPPHAGEPQAERLLERADVPLHRAQRRGEAELVVFPAGERQPQRLVG